MAGGDDELVDAGLGVGISEVVLVDDGADAETGPDSLADEGERIVSERGRRDPVARAELVDVVDDPGRATDGPARVVVEEERRAGEGADVEGPRRNRTVPG